MSKNDPDEGKTCKQLVRRKCAYTMERLRVLVAAYKLGEKGYLGVKEVADRRDAFKARFPKSPLRNPDIVAAEKEFYRDEKAEIQSLIDKFSNDELFIFNNIEDADCYGGQDALGSYGYGFSYTEYDKKHDYGGFFMWLLYGGGPSGEIQFYAELIAPEFPLRKVRFHYKDWFDGAGITLSGQYLKTAEFVFDYFKELGVVESAYNEYLANNKIPVGHISDR